MKSVIGFWLLLVTLALGSAAHAQPVCNPSFPGTLACQPQAVNPQLSDIVAATQSVGPNRSNQSVKMSLSQMLSLGGSSLYLPFTGGQMTGLLDTAASTTGGAGFNLSPGGVPTASNPGDLWVTASGLFVNVNGSVLGPLGAGGGVNAGTLNALGYYAGAGNTLSALAPSANTILQANGSSVPSFSATLPPGLTIPLAVLQSATYATSAALPSVTATNEGQTAFVINCLNGTESGGGGTGCFYGVNNTGSWVPRPSIPTQQITVGGQALSLGGATTNQGTGLKIQLATGSFVSGHALAFDANGTAIDAGVVPGGGSGGNGTVTAGTLNQIAWYSASGTAVAGLASVNSSVLSTSGAGVPAFSTTLPTGLTIPAPTISAPALTGTGTYGSLTGSGKLITTASTPTQAGLNAPPGVAPTSPANGDLWSTSAGFFMRFNGATFTVGSGNGTLTGATTAAPLTGGGTTGTLALACPTCLTATGGGPLVAALPLLFNPTTSTISLGAQTKTFTFNADQFTTIGNANYSVYLTFPYTTGSITSVAANTGGANSPSFAISMQIAGGNIASCSGLTVSPTTPVAATCGSNTMVNGNAVQLVISGVNGQPSSAVIQVNYTVSAI